MLLELHYRDPFLAVGRRGLKDFIGGQFASCRSTTVTQPQDGSGTNITAIDIGANGTVEVQDKATVTGSGVANPPTPTGDVRFFICKLIASPATCTSGGDAVLPNQTLSPVSAGVASATSAKVTLTSAGRYCFRAEYLGDSNYPAGPGGQFKGRQRDRVLRRQPATAEHLDGGESYRGPAARDGVGRHCDAEWHGKSA